MKNVFDDFFWHSAIGMDEALHVNQDFVVKMANTEENRDHFITAGDNLLVHKTTQALEAESSMARTAGWSSRMELSLKATAPLDSTAPMEPRFPTATEAASPIMEF